jgi:Zn-dependent protease with chaperone function
VLPSVSPPQSWVLDHPLPEAGVRGAALILSRPLLESDSLAAVLAHELGHLQTIDGRLTEGLDRLRIWDDPLRPLDDDDEAFEADAGLPLFALRWLIRLAGGGAGETVLAPAWAAYWRSREFAADSHAAALGQADDLARHLADHEQPLDFACRSLPFNPSQHPPVAHRIDRLLAASPAAVSE